MAAFDLKSGQTSGSGCRFHFFRLPASLAVTCSTVPFNDARTEHDTGVIALKVRNAFFYPLHIRNVDHYVAVGTFKSYNVGSIA